MLRKLNKISRNLYISGECDRIHMPNRYGFDEKRRGGRVLSHFYIESGVNVHANEVLKNDSGKINPYETSIDASNGSDDFT